MTDGSTAVSGGRSAVLGDECGDIRQDKLSSQKIEKLVPSVDVNGHWLLAGHGLLIRLE